MSPTLLLVLLAIPPLSLALAAPVARRAPLRSGPLTLAAGAGLVVTAALIPILILSGPAQSLGGLLRLDAVSLTMLALVAVLGAILLRYSRRYLAGDPAQGRFLARLATTLATVQVLVTAGHLAVLTAAWIATSLALHGLLVFRPERPRARIAARKKFILARIGDAALIVAAVLLAQAFGSAELGTIIERARADLAAGITHPLLPWAGACIALTAGLKSALMPTHGWVVEVMETPTPVSALLHAGILNGGAFLVVRLADAMLHAPAALAVLLALGGLTAALSSLIMVTQSGVKTGLGYSSIAHMGFMLFLCGLGAFPMALIHLVAHSCYKAYAFLAAGSAVEQSRLSRLAGPPAPAPLWALGPAFALAVAVVGLGAWAVAVTPATRPVESGVALVLALALAPLLAQAWSRHALRALAGFGLLAALVTSAAFFLLELVGLYVYPASLPVTPPAEAHTLVLMGALLAVFAATVLVQALLARHAACHPRWAALALHLRNGCYLNVAFDRLVGAYSQRLQRAP